MRSYVITKTTPDEFEVIGVMSSKKLAIQTCELASGEGGEWVFKDKHDGQYKLGETTVSYMMFFTNKGIDNGSSS